MTHEPILIAEDATFANVSTDGSTVFFTSPEAIPGVEPNDAGEEAEPSAHNLYAWHDAGPGTVSFIAQLDPTDSFRWTEAVNPGSGRTASPGRSTPDGAVFVFESQAQLSEYENEGRAEVYRFDPEAVVGERLLCVSCDPSGTPPSADAKLVDFSTGRGIDEKTLITNVTDDGGAVFFESWDRLLPEDANNVIDVYEWKAMDAGGCGQPEGCLALISSGQGESDSHLYSMSADGDDVFFWTREKLVGQDVLGSPSIYDARSSAAFPTPSAGSMSGRCLPAARCFASPARPAGTGMATGPPDRSNSSRPPCARGKQRAKGAV